MIPSLYVFIAGMVVISVSFMGGVKVGRTMEKNVTIEADLTHANLVHVKQVILIKEVPKIITKTVTKEVKVTEVVERVITQIDKAIPPDCVLPDNYGMLLVSAAHGIDGSTPGGANDFAGTYGCREVIEATLKDLRAGWRNTVRLDGLQSWAKLVTTKGE